MMLWVGFGVSQASGMTLASAAMPAPALMRELTQVTGEAHAARAEFADDVLVVVARQVPPGELRQQVALALNGEWAREESGRWVLTKPPRLAAEERATSVRLRQQGIDAALATVRKRLEQPFDAAELATRVQAAQQADSGGSVGLRRQQALRLEGPLGRLMQRLLLAIPPEQLAQIPPDTRAVFRVQPNARQRAIPLARAEAAMTAFRQEVDTWVKQPLVAKETPDGFHIGDPRLLREPIPEDHPPYGLVVRPVGARGSLEVSLTHPRDPNSVRGEVARATFSPPGLSPSDAASLGLPAPATDVPLRWDPWQLELLRVARPASEYRPEPGPLSAELTQRLTRVQEHDPLELFLGPIVRQWADRKQVNVVAVLPESEFYGPTASPARVDAQMQRWVRLNDARMDSEGSWRRIVPNNPLRWRELRIPRASLAEYIGSNRGLDASVELLVAKPTQDRSLAGWLDRFSGPDNLIGRDRWQWPLLWGALPREMRQRLRRGEPVGLAQLPPRSRGFFEDAVYQQSFFVAGVGTVDATDLFPTSLPGTAMLYLQMRKSPGYLLWQRKFGTWATSRFISQAPEPGPSGRVTRGERQEYTLNLQLREGLVCTWKFVDTVPL